MKRLPRLSLAVALCVTFLLSASALAEKPLPTQNEAQVSWLEKLGNVIHDFVTDLFGVDTEQPLTPADDDNVEPAVYDHTGLVKRPWTPVIMRDDGWAVRDR